MEKLYTPNEVANLLGLCTKSVYTLIKRGELAAYQVGRSKRVSTDQIMKCLRAEVEVIIDYTKTGKVL
jgi:excisionase family DNA binding protein